MLLVAIQMLMGERIKYLILICALAFSTLLMTQQAGVFWGVMRWTTTKMRNTKAPIWVVDPSVEQVNDVKALRDTDLARVRSVAGVEWALPLYFSLIKAKLYSGKFMNVDLFGVDDTTLLGIPPKIVKGKVKDLWKPQSIILDKAVIRTLSENLPKPVDVGDVIDINDHEMKIVGIVEGEETLFGSPAVYTTYSTALEVVPPVRRNLGYILVHPHANVSPEELAKNIKKETGLRAFTDEELFWSTIWWYVKNTGIPSSFFTTISLGFVVGVAVAGQTFYSFVHENIGNFGALRAMGASNALLQRMLLIQAALAGFIGYGIGLGLTALFGFFTISYQRLPFALPWPILAMTFVSINIICLFTAYLGIRKIRRIDPAEVFRG